VVGNWLKAFINAVLSETVRRMPKRIVLSSVHGSAPVPAWDWPLSPTSCISAEDAPSRRAYAKIGVSPDGGSTVGMVGTVGVRRALQIFLAEAVFSAQSGA